MGRLHCRPIGGCRFQALLGACKGAAEVSADLGRYLLDLIFCYAEFLRTWHVLQAALRVVCCRLCRFDLARLGLHAGFCSSMCTLTSPGSDDAVLLAQNSCACLHRAFAGRMQVHVSCCIGRHALCRAKGGDRRRRADLTLRVATCNASVLVLVMHFSQVISQQYVCERL